MSTSWTPLKMITRKRAESVARELFPDDFHAGDCRAEHGREGQPCRICVTANEAWATRVQGVRNAMLTAFGHPEYRDQNDA